MILYYLYKYVIMNISIFNIFIILGLVLVLGFMGCRYVYNLKSDISELNLANSELRSALANSNKTISELKESYSEIAKVSKELQSDIISREDELNTLSKKFSKLEKASLKHPKMTEKVINNATSKTLKCFEDIAKDKTCEEK